MWALLLAVAKLGESVQYHAARGHPRPLPSAFGNWKGRIGVPLESSKALEDVDLYDVGHKAIDCNDDLDEATSNENALKEYVELVQTLKLT